MILDCTFVSVAMNQVRRNNRYTDAMLKSLDVALNTEKCFGVFARSSTRQSGDREHACARRVRVCMCIFFYSWSHPPSPLQSQNATGTLYFHPRRDRSICFAAGIACLAATSFLFPPSLFICLPLPLFFSLPASLSPLALHGRSEQWTNRLDVISTYPRIHV